jgi:hypothetical protein
MSLKHWIKWLPYELGAFGTTALMSTGRWLGSTASCAGINETLSSKLENSEESFDEYS